METKKTALYAVVRLIRIRTLFWFSVSTCYGFASVILQSFPPPDFIFLVLAIVFANMGAIITNDITDVEIDRVSSEPIKQARPLASKEISIRTATILAVIFYSLSILVAMLYGHPAELFCTVIILFSLAYSLPPFRLCARPYASILFWVALCIVCYGLMAFTLQTKYGATDSMGLAWAKPGIIFITSIVFFMGVAEILAKDLRDRINDALGGRNTFVNFIGVDAAARVLIFFSWLGYILWVEVLYLSEVLLSLSAIACLLLGFVWCLRTHFLSIKLTKAFDQALAAQLHIQWTYIYAAMQLLTAVAFYFK